MDECTGGGLLLAVLAFVAWRLDVRATLRRAQRANVVRRLQELTETPARGRRDTHTPGE